MEEITFKEFLKKSGQMLEKYRSNLDHLRKLRDSIERSFFLQEEMVEYFHSNKSEYHSWMQAQDSIVALEDAFSELLGNMMDARAAPEEFKYYLKDQRLPIIEMIEDDEEEEEEELII